jgi:hypothetical protein
LPGPDHFRLHPVSPSHRQCSLGAPVPSALPADEILGQHGPSRERSYRLMPWGWTQQNIVGRCRHGWAIGSTINPRSINPASDPRSLSTRGDSTYALSALLSRTSARPSPGDHAGVQLAEEFEERFQKSECFQDRDAHWVVLLVGRNHRHTDRMITLSILGQAHPATGTVTNCNPWTGSIRLDGRPVVARPSADQHSSRHRGQPRCHCRC